MKLLLLVLLFCVISVSADTKKCRALALSGGGSKGAYEAAVYVGLVNNLPVEEVSYDVITGVSAGSLNTLGLSVFEPSDVVNSSDFIFALWNSISDYTVYKNWPLGIAQGLFKKSGIFDLAPGFDWVSERLGDRTVKRKVSFATVDANAAEYVVWDYNATDTQPADIIESAFASSSIPGIFPHRSRGDKVLIDGGTVWNLDLASAIRRCREVVDDDKDIIVDMVLCGDHKLDRKDDLDRYSTLDHLMRSIEVHQFYNGMSDYQSSMILFPEVDFRYFIAPSESINTALFPLDFTQKQVDICFEVGQKDAKNSIKLGHGGYAKVAMEYVKKLRNGEDVYLRTMIEEALNKTQASS